MKSTSARGTRKSEPSNTRSAWSASSSSVGGTKSGHSWATIVRKRTRAPNSFSDCAQISRACSGDSTHVAHTQHRRCSRGTSSIFTPLQNALGDVRVEAHRRCAVLQLQQDIQACDPPRSRGWGYNHFNSGKPKRYTATSMSFKLCFAGFFGIKAIGYCCGM